jgi:ParB-like nuclease domain
MITSGLVRYHDALEPMLVDIDTLSQHPRNYNNADVDKIAESIEVNGMYRPIYVQRHTGMILAGNHTWVACKQLGADRIPVVELDIDDATANRILVGDNWIASLAIPDHALLLELLTEIDADNALLGTGFTADDMDRLQHSIEAAPPPVAEETFPFRCPNCGHEWTGSPHG